MYQLKSLQYFSLHEFTCTPISIYRKAFLRRLKHPNLRMTSRRYFHFLEDLIYDQAICDASLMLATLGINSSTSSRLSYDDIDIPGWLFDLPQQPFVSKINISEIKSGIKLNSLRTYFDFFKSLVSSKFDKRKNKPFKH